MPVLQEVTAFGAFLRGLPAFLRRRMTADEARAIVALRMARRAGNFASLAERCVFANARSPYNAMLRIAGCTFGDLRQMLDRDGLEDTLRALRASGVYVSFEEFKGQQPIVRSGQEIPAAPADFDNPELVRFHTISTGGSTGRSRRVLMDLDHLMDRLPMSILGDTAHGTFGLPTAMWFEIPPGNGLDSVLLRVPADNIPERWFTPIRGGRDGASWRFRAATFASVAVARAAGARIPRPEYLPLDRAHAIAHWAREALRRHGACVVRAHVSKALRVCLAARAEGLDLSGAIIVSGGEPPTPAKVAQIRATGAEFRSTYYFTEAGPVGLSCTTSSDPNDQHLYMDHLALIQAPRAVPGFDFSVPSFHYTTVLGSAPKILLNVESDDFGTVETRSCGCPFEELGFTTHISGIRSYRKLTGEGVTLIGSDMEYILEEALPASCGGSPLDYQIVEEEDEHGFTRLTVRVHPSVAIASEQQVIDAILRALAGRSGAADMSRGIWRQAGTFRVRREAPTLTSRGKLMPLVVNRSGGVARLGGAS
jgi:hypothetical protein